MYSYSLISAGLSINNALLFRNYYNDTDIDDLRTMALSITVYHYYWLYLKVVFD